MSVSDGGWKKTSQNLFTYLSENQTSGKKKSLKSFKHILQILVCIFHPCKLAFNVNVEVRCVWRKISLLSLNSMLWLIIKLDTTIVFISFIIQCPYLISLYYKSFQAILYLVSF